MKKSTILFILLIFTIVSNAQFSYQKLVSKDNFEKAFKKAKSELSKNENSILANYNLAILHYLYSKKIFRSYNYDKLKNNIDEANKYLIITDKLTNTDSSIVFENNQLEKLETKICKLAFDIAKLKGKNNVYENYITKYSNCTLNIEKAKEAIYKNDYFVAEMINTLHSYQRFIKKHPNNDYSYEAIRRIDSLLILKQEKDSIKKLNKLAINQKIIKGEKDTAIINQYMKYASFIKPVWLKRVDFNRLKGNIIKRNKSSNDSLDNIYGYLLNLPLDIKYSEIPYLVKTLDSLLYDGKLPIDAEYYSINNDLHELMKLINKYDKDNYLDPLRNQLLLLNNKYWKNLPMGENSKWVEESFTIKKFQCKSKGFHCLYNSLEQMILERLKIGLYDAIIAHGIKLSSNIPYIEKELKTTELELRLKITRKNNNPSEITKLEKKLVRKLVKALNQYYDKKSDIDLELIEQSPSYFLVNNQQPNCVGFTMITSSFLDKWHIKSNVIFRSGHIFTNITFNNQSSYIVDVMYNDKLIQPTIIDKIGNYNSMQMEEDTVYFINKNTRQGIAGAFFLNIDNQQKKDEERNLSDELLLNKESTLLIPFLESSWYNIAMANKKLKYFEEAEEAINVCLFNYPRGIIAWLVKSEISLELNDLKGYEQAVLKHRELQTNKK